MTSRQRYIKRRAERLARRGIKLYRVDGVYRNDAPDDDEPKNNSAGRSGGHGNTKIPFGLCKREGIKIGQDWTPKDAWNALEGKGYSASETYKELKETGKVAPKAPKAPKKTPAELKKMGKSVSDLKKNMKKRDKLEKDLDKVSVELRSATREKERYENGIRRANENAEKILSRYGSEDKISREKASDDWWAKSPYDDYQDYRKLANSYRRDAENAEKKVAELEQKKSGVEGQLSSHPGRDEYKRQYDQAVDELLSNSPYTGRVRDYRTLEEESEESRKKLVVAQGKVDYANTHITFYEAMARRARENGDEETAKFYENGGLAANKKLLEVNQAAVETLTKEVADYDRRMNEAKSEAPDKDWKQIYELSVERDTVQNGPYDTLKTAASSLERGKVKYLNPIKYLSQPTEEKIISTLCGDDKTAGSCASLALAYFINKSGYKVLDFRGGESRRFFSYNCGDIIRTMGGQVVRDSDGFKIANDLLSQVEEGKEYYFAAGRHAAVVRKTNGKLQYLELQDSDGGWNDLDDSILKRRFKVKRTHRRGSEHSYLIDGSKLSESKELTSLMGYINTASDKQKKGAGGSIK